MCPPGKLSTSTWQIWAAALACFRLRAAWAILLIACVLSLLAIWLPHPIEDEGPATLEWMAAVVHVAVTLWVVAYLSSHTSAPAPAWWPAAPSWSLAASSLGAFGALSCKLLALLSLQLFLVSGTGRFSRLDPLTEVPVSLAGDYGILAVLGLCELGLLVSWTRLLRTLLGTSPALIALIILVLTGFYVPRITSQHPTLLALLGWLPDLGALSPLMASRVTSTEARALLGYTVVHSAAVLGAASLVGGLVNGRGTRIDLPRKGP